VCLSVRIIPRDIQSRMDERGFRIWKLYYLVVRLTKLPAQLEPFATSMGIICMFGVWLCFSCIVHWCYIFRYCRIGGCVVLLFVLIFPVMRNWSFCIWLVFLLFFQCQRSKSSSNRMPQKMLSPSFTLISFIPVVFSAPIVFVAFQAIVGTKPKECSESQKTSTSSIRYRCFSAARNVHK
jgi:hypothetical protein